MLPYRRRLEKKNTLTGESRYLAEASREQEGERSGKSVISTFRVFTEYQRVSPTFNFPLEIIKVL